MPVPNIIKDFWRKVRLGVGLGMIVFGTLLVASPKDITFQVSGPDVVWVHQEMFGVGLVGWGLLLLTSNLRKFLKPKDGERRIVASVFIFTGFWIGVAFLWEHKNLEAIGILGLILLATILIASNWMSDDDEISFQEVRNAIAISVVAMFAGLIGVARDDRLVPGSVLSSTFDHFWQILMTVIGAYFGATAIEKGLQRLPIGGAPVDPAGGGGAGGGKGRARAADSKATADKPAAGAPAPGEEPRPAITASGTGREPSGD